MKVDNKLTLIFMVLWSNLIWLTCSFNCPSYCFCTRTRGRCELNNRPYSVCSRKWVNLKLKLNNWNEITPFTFAKCSSLNHLTLSGGFDYIKKDDLNILADDLNDFTLKDSKITTLPNRVFIYLRHLKTIRITRNRLLHKIEPEFSFGLEKLYHLDLSYNNIQDLSKSFDILLLNLRILRLNNNNITIMSKNNFKQFRYLKILDLSYNSIKTIEPFVFRGLSELIRLNINNNLIESLNSLELLEMQKLRILDLSFNKFKSFSLPSCEDNLKLIFLNNNLLNHLPVINQGRCVNLKLVAIKNNQKLMQCKGQIKDLLFDVNVCRSKEYSLSYCGNWNSENSCHNLYNLLVILIVLCIILLGTVIIVPFICYKHRVRIYKLKYGGAGLKRKFSLQT